MKCCCFNLPLAKRKLVSIPLGIMFGFLCAYLAWSGDSTLKNNPNFWWSPLMWAIVYNRFLISWVVLVLGVYIRCPIGWRILPVFRGLLAGVIVSIDLAIGAMIGSGENAWKYFWLTVVAGAIYGAIIDVIATKVAGEGPELLDFSCSIGEKKKEVTGEKKKEVKSSAKKVVKAKKVKSKK